MGLRTYFYLLFISAFCIINVSILANFVSSFQPSCSDNERLALLHFKHSFQIDCASSPSPSFAHPKVKSWTLSDTEDCCSWEGVECDEDTGQVIGLDLSNSCLQGPFPPNSSLFDLSHLKDLNLAFNYFNYSQIPSQFGRFHKLQTINLSNSAFSGQISLDISKLSKLSLLDLSNSYIQAYSIPILKLHDPNIDMLVQNLTSLQILKLDRVDMSTNFPTVLSNLSSLKELTLQLCNVYGELPQNLFRLPHLEVLRLGGNNNLAGFLPKFQWHSPLKILHLSFTALSGEVPTSIGKLSHLDILALENCQFSGLLPSSLSNLTTLTQLILDGNNFQGDIPFSFMNLTELQVLSLSNLNVKPGQLFSQLPKLQALIALGLIGMKLDSEIPSLLANFTRLQFLDLGSSNLKGPFPDCLANLTQLRQLSLLENELTGPIPQWISQLTNLKLLTLTGNNFLVMFETFFKLKNLLFLNLSGNKVIFPPISGNNASILQLHGLELARCNLTEFPQFLQLQNQLQLLSLAENNIRGSIPQWFVVKTKDSLSFIDLSSNNLTGFEKSAVVLPWNNNLEYIDISGNSFRGQLPIPSNSIKEYLVSSNQFTGVIPIEICNAKSIISIDLSNNMLNGIIPYCIANQLGDSLQLLDLRSNKLIGSIPPAFTRSCKVKMINLSNNKLDGDLPKSLINCSMLEVLDIGRNRVNGTFPTWLGSLPKLQVLVLNHNGFHGRIPDPESGHNFQLLRIIDLSYNLHSGDFPSGYLRNWHEMKESSENQSEASNTHITNFFQVGLTIYKDYQSELDYSITITNKGNERLYTKILKVFRVVDFSSNNFTGRIPDIIGNLQGLQALNLSNNKLHGRIPSSLSNITDLESLDISRNMLSGEIPLALSRLTSLEVFNVSYNQLEGPIPIGNQFNTFDNSSFQGNLRLCGVPLSKTCIHDAPQSPPHTMANEDSELINWIIRSFGFLSGCIFGYVIGKFYITDKYHEWFMETFGRQRPRRRVQRAQRHRR